MKQMLIVGGFPFSLSNKTGYDRLTNTSDGGFVSIARYGQKPLSQNTGQQLKTKTITGTWFGAKGMENMEAFRGLQDKRAPVVIVDGYGTNLGRWSIKKITENQDCIIDDGTAMKQSFTIIFEEYVGE